MTPSWRFSAWCVVALVTCLASPAAAAPPTELFSTNPEPNSGNFGFALAFIGDLNGDGRDDFIVGARGEKLLTSNPADAFGRAYLISGLDGSVLVTLEGQNAGDQFGASVAGGGDFDGDGTPDYAVGAPGADPGGVAFAGTVTIYSGATHVALHQVDGTIANGLLGQSISFAGNLLRDETYGLDVYDDLVVAAPGNSSSFGSSRVFLVGNQIDATLLPTIVTTTLTPNSGDKRFGLNVAGVGDFNGDGTPDVGITAPSSADFVNSLTSNRGRAYVYSGAGLALGSTSQLLAVAGTSNNELLGSAIAGAGNFDGVGADEVVIGSSSFDNSAHSGSNHGAMEVFSFTAGSLLRIQGHAPNNQFGSSATGVGDGDGDGFDDVLVGAKGPSSAIYPGGEAFLVAGSAASGVSEDLSVTTRVIWTVSDVISITGGDSVGESVVGGGDLDGDGRPDWAVGASARDATGLASDGVVIQATAAVEFPPPDPTNVAITAPLSGDLLTGAGILFTATADNADEVEFFVNGSSVGSDLAAPYAVTFDSGLFPDGGASLTIEARKSGGGLTGAGPVLVELDNTSPLLVITAPVAAAVVGGTIDFTADASDPNGVVRVSFTAGTTLSFTDLAAPYYTAFDTTLEPDGSALLAIEAEDGLGNIGSVSLAVIVDNTSPAVVISSHVDGQYVSGTLSIAIAASDLHLERVDVFVEANLVASVTDFSGPITVPFDTTTVADGPLAIEATAHDAAGSSAVSPGVTLLVDNTLPEKTIGEPADGERVKGDFQISVSATDTGSGIASLEVFAGGQSVIQTTLASASVTFDSLTVIDGPLAIVCVVEDLAGNQRIETNTVQVDNLKLKLKPKDVNPLSSGGGEPVSLELKGGSVGLLAPVASHGFQLRLAGAFTLNALGGDAAPDGDNLRVEFDRAELISLINNQFVDPPKKLELEVLADGQVLGTVSLKISKPKHGN